MNEQNYDYLKNQVKYSGFGDELEQQLKEQMAQQQGAFMLSHKTKFGEREGEATLHFRKSDQSDLYFFNKYELELAKKDQAGVIKQTFYIGKDNNITLKEAFNLMEGRAVHKQLVNKEQEPYKAWIQLDFKETDNAGNYKLKHFHENYGYDLEQTLAKYPVKELNHPEDKERLMDSLRKGNRQAVTFLKEGVEEKRFIEAAPRFKTLNQYDEHSRKVGRARNQKETATKGKKKEQKEGMEEDGKEQQKRKRKGRKIG